MLICISERDEWEGSLVENRTLCRRQFKANWPEKALHQSFRASLFRVIVWLSNTGSLSPARNFVRLNLMMLSICSTLMSIQQLTLSFQINGNPDDVPTSAVQCMSTVPKYTCVCWQQGWEAESSFWSENCFYECCWYKNYCLFFRW